MILKRGVEGLMFSAGDHAVQHDQAAVEHDPDNDRANPPVQRRAQAYRGIPRRGRGHRAGFLPQEGPIGAATPGYRRGRRPRYRERDVQVE